MSAIDTSVEQRLKIYYLNGFVDFYMKQFPDLLQNIHKDLGSKLGLHKVIKKLRKYRYLLLC